MGQDSKIQWTTHTFNCWTGCARVSPGCTHCYAESWAKRSGLVEWGPGGTRRRTSAANWRKPLAWDRAVREAGERHRVFCASLADVFEDFPGLDEIRVDLWALIESTPHLDWLLLTKRPGNIWDMIPAKWLDEPRPNVWFGTTVEDQRRADERIPRLLEIPATVRFLSCEPLLEDLHLNSWLWVPGGVMDTPDGREFYDPEPSGEIDWIIVGGESGHGARPFQLDWARSLILECQQAGVACFIKQLGACATDERNGIAGASLCVPPDATSLISRRFRDGHGGDWSEWPEDLRVREFPAVRVESTHA